MKWSENPTEDQLLCVFHTLYTFRVMKALMKEPMTVKQLVNEISATNYERVYPAIKFLRTKGLIKVKEYVFNGEFSKVAIFTPTIKNLIVTIAKETTVTTDTKLLLHSEKFENVSN